MTVKRNIIANFTGQGYTIIIGIIVTPLYLQFLGPEAYGLVGFFALMQAWLNLLDSGMSPTLARQVAFARGQKNGFEFFKKLLKSFELIFIVLALIIIACIYLASEWLTQAWVKAETLDSSAVIYSIKLMGLMIGLRWFASLYRSGINGMEDQVWLNVVYAFLLSLKFIGALILLAFISQDIKHFFQYQLLIGVIEMLIFMWRFYRKLPKTEYSSGLIAFDWKAVKSVAPFALGIGYTTGIWILLTQTDKLILSGILSLTDFGYFSLVALVSGGVLVLSGPIAHAIMPRMTLLLSQGKPDEMLNLYRQASQIVTVICLSVSLIIGLYTEPLIFAWTGDKDAATWVSKVLIWFALGNGILGLGAFQYYLQSAFGQLRLHVIGSSFSALVQLPIIYFAALNFGALGAGISWFGIRLIWFVIWTPIVHKRFVPGFHLQWLAKDIFPIAVITVGVALILSNYYMLDLEQNRLLIISKIFCLGLMLLTISALSSRLIRSKLKSIWD